MRLDAKLGYYATAHPGSKIYSATVSSTTAYLDLPPGEYDAWAPAGAAAEHFRWCYLSHPPNTSAPTIAAASFPAPTAATGSQASGVPTGAQGAGMAPATASPLRIHIARDTRCAILYSAAGPVTLHLTKVL